MVPVVSKPSFWYSATAGAFVETTSNSACSYPTVPAVFRISSSRAVPTPSPQNARYREMDPGDISQLELELGDIIFRIQDNRFTEEIPFGYEGEENYTDYMEWGGDYDGGWMDTTLTFSLYSDGSQDPGCGYMTTHFRGMESTGKLYYLGGNQFRWESGGYDSAWPETYYVYAVYNNSEYQLELYNSDGEYEVTFTLYEQYIP